VKVLALLAACVLFSCGGESGPATPTGPGDDPAAVPQVGRVFLDNRTPYVVEVAYVDSFTTAEPSIERSVVGAGERRDISGRVLPAAVEVEFDLAFQLPGERDFRIRRKALVRIDGEVVVVARLETADDPFSLLLESFPTEDQAYPSMRLHGRPGDRP
jgi:hypothetical protein